MPAYDDYHHGSRSPDAALPAVRAQVAPESQSSGAVPEVREPVLGPSPQDASEEGEVVDWIKLPVARRDDPRIDRMAQRMGVSFHEALGIYAYGLTYCGEHETPDLPSSMPKGSREAMREVGLLTENGLLDYAESVKALSEYRERERKRKRDRGSNPNNPQGGARRKLQKESARAKSSSKSRVREELEEESEKREEDQRPLKPSASAGAEPVDSTAPRFWPSLLDAEPSPEAISQSKTGQHLEAAFSWSRRACEMWESRFGVGSVAAAGIGGRIAKRLKPLQDAHGWPAVENAWSRFLEQSDAAYVNPERFAATFGDWCGNRPEKRKLGPVDESIAALGLDPDSEGVREFMRGWHNS